MNSKKKARFSSCFTLCRYQLFRADEPHPGFIFENKDAWYWGGSKWSRVPFLREFKFRAFEIRENEFLALAAEKHADIRFLDRLTEKRTVLKSPPENPAIHYDIPSGYNEIAEEAFWNFIGFGSVTIPGTVSVIGPRAFSGCVNLKKVQIPDSVNVIGEGAFSKCIRLEEIELPDSIATFEDSCFAGCISLQRVRIPGNTAVIGAYSFMGCLSLEEIKLPDTLVWIQQEAFRSCRSLKQIFIPDSVRRIEQNAFDDCVSLEKVSVPDGLEAAFDAARVKVEIRKRAERIVMADPPKPDFRDTEGPDRLLNDYYYNTPNEDIDIRFSDFPELIWHMREGSKDVFLKAVEKTGVSFAKARHIPRLYCREIEYCLDFDSFLDLAADIELRFSFRFRKEWSTELQVEMEDIRNAYFEKLRRIPDLIPQGDIENGIVAGDSNRVISACIKGARLTRFDILGTPYYDNLSAHTLYAVAFIGIPRQRREELVDWLKKQPDASPETVDFFEVEYKLAEKKAERSPEETQLMAAVKAGNADMVGKLSEHVFIDAITDEEVLAAWHLPCEERTIFFQKTLGLRDQAILLAKLLEQGNRIDGVEMVGSDLQGKPENLTDVLIAALLV